MGESGNVRLETVLSVLRAHQIAISRHDGTGYVLAKGDRLEVIEFPKQVGRRMLQRLQRLFGVPIHHFYNPLMAPGPSDDIVN